MNPELEPVKEIAKRFRWLSSERVMLINSEGAEKIVDLKNGFEEVSYCSVPLFDIKKVAEYKHYYFH
jgi:hypothetical protein